MKIDAIPEAQLYPSSLGDLLKRQLFWLLLLRIILYTLITIISLILLDERFEAIVMPPSLLVLFTLIVYLSTIVSAFTLLHLQSEYRRFGFIQTLFDVVFASMLVYLTGGSLSIFSSVYFFPIISGGLLIPLKGGLFGAATATLLFALVLLLDFFSYLPDYVLLSKFYEQDALSSNIRQFGTRGLTFFLGAFISAMFGTMLRSTTRELSSTKYDFDRLSLLYKIIFDNIGTGILTINREGIITSANNATSDITGQPPGELIGKALKTLFPGMDLTSSSPRNSCDYMRNDKQTLRLGYALTELGPSTGRDDGDENLEEEDVTIITLKDIGEIERLENQMRQAEKLAAIGMMSASIAHDFRNPLAAISGSAQVLADELGSAVSTQPQNYELTKIIVRESDRLADTISSFLKFARPENIKRDWFLLRTCVDDILQVCKADQKWPATCSIVLQIDANFRVWGDEKQLFGVISQLVQNALSFCPKGNEKLELSSSTIRVADNQELCLIQISDNGSGVDPNDIQKIFEPFYTSRSDGTGLGLAIAKQVIEGHNGSIAVEKSELGGACFTLILPLEIELDD
ncbi:MAG: PAS domain-containing protein [Desulfofustis sp.]|nr:PAS domain-containing protein [Desulfofustis sp.]